MKKDFRIVLCICAALGWWGFLYPELALTPDTYRVVDEEGESAQEGLSESRVPESAADLYWEILGADKGKVRFRSRLWEHIREGKKND